MRVRVNSLGFLTFWVYVMQSTADAQDFAKLYFILLTQRIKINRKCSATHDKLHPKFTQKLVHDYNLPLLNINTEMYSKSVRLSLIKLLRKRYILIVQE